MAKQKKNYIVGIDIGGTKVLAALMNSSFEVIARKKIKTDSNKGEAVFFKGLTEGVNSVLKEAGVLSRQLLAIGVGCPGIIDLPRGVITVSPNISFLKNYPLQERIQKHFRVSTTVENDVNAGLYGEYRFGAACGHEHVAGIFMGTGVGGALILNGELYRGSTGGAGEIGHTFLELPSFASGEQHRSTLESNTGRLRIQSDAGLLIMRQKAPALFKLAGYDIKKIKSNTMAKAIKAGDTELAELILHKARLVGISMANIVNLLSPSLIVLGGGMVEAMGNIILPEARLTMKKYAMRPLAARVRVQAAKLKDDAVFLGAAALAVERVRKGRRAS